MITRASPFSWYCLLRETARRRQREAAGRAAEQLAALRLYLTGYRILARRFRCRAGEIDLIAVRGNRLAFVEVKQRSTATDASRCLDQIDPRRLYRAAAVWRQRNPGFADLDMHYDVMLVPGGAWPCHHRDALTPHLARGWA